jgi:calcitonin receptor-like
MFVIFLYILCCCRGASTILRQSLKCTRIYIHRNLFASFIINNAMWLLWYKGVADQPEVLLDNRVIQKPISFSIKYRTTAYYCIIYYLSITNEAVNL